MMRWLQWRWLHGEEPIMGGGWGRSGDGFTGGHGGTLGAKKKD
jgi:hypothetical protein